MKRRTLFTLIELLIVIAIIAILARVGQGEAERAADRLFQQPEAGGDGGSELSGKLR